MSQPTHTLVADPAATARTLRDAASYLARHGWVQGGYYDTSATCFTPAACLVGALAMVCYGGPVDAPAQHFDAAEFDDFEEVIGYLDGCLDTWYGLCCYEFNDTPGRTAAQVIAALHVAAGVLSAPVVAHADYPHEPGTLYDCPACEGRCFCPRPVEQSNGALVVDTVCVRCALVSEALTQAPAGAS